MQGERAVLVAVRYIAAGFVFVIREVERVVIEIADPDEVVPLFIILLWVECLLVRQGFLFGPKQPRRTRTLQLRLHVGADDAVFQDDGQETDDLQNLEDDDVLVVGQELDLGQLLVEVLIVRFLDHNFFALAEADHGGAEHIEHIHDSTQLHLEDAVPPQNNLRISALRYLLVLELLLFVIFHVILDDHEMLQEVLNVRLIDENVHG